MNALHSAESVRRPPFAGKTPQRMHSSALVPVERRESIAAPVERRESRGPFADMSNVTRTRSAERKLQMPERIIDRRSSCEELSRQASETRLDTMNAEAAAVRVTSRGSMKAPSAAVAPVRAPAAKVSNTSRTASIEQMLAKLCVDRHRGDIHFDEEVAPAPVEAPADVQVVVETSTVGSGSPACPLGSKESRSPFAEIGNVGHTRNQEHMLDKLDRISMHFAAPEPQKPPRNPRSNKAPPTTDEKPGKEGSEAERSAKVLPIPKRSSTTAPRPALTPTEQQDFKTASPLISDTAPVTLDTGMPSGMDTAADVATIPTKTANSPCSDMVHEILGTTKTRSSESMVEQLDRIKEACAEKARLLKLTEDPPVAAVTSVTIGTVADEAHAKEEEPATQASSHDTQAAAEKPAAASGNLQRMQSKGKGKGVAPGPPPLPGKRLSAGGPGKMTTRLPFGKQVQLKQSYSSADSPTAFSCGTSLEFRTVVRTASQPVAESPRKSFSGASPRKTVSVLGQQRTLSMELGLSTMSVPTSQLAIALQALDIHRSGVSLDDVERALGKMPTAAEAEQLLEHAQNNPTLTKFEQVVLPLCHVPNAERRLQIMHCALVHTAQHRTLIGQLRCVREAAAEALACERLHTVLCTALSIANAVNHGNTEGAKSFPISSFPEFAKYKLEGRSILHFLCQLLQKNDTEFFQKLNRELSHVIEAAQFNTKELQASLKNFHDMAAEVREHLKSEDSATAEAHCTELLGLLTREGKELETAEAIANAELQKAQVFLGERTTLPCETFFSHIAKVGSCLEKMCNEAPQQLDHHCLEEQVAGEALVLPAFAAQASVSQLDDKQDACDAEHDVHGSLVAEGLDLDESGLALGGDIQAEGRQRRASVPSSVVSILGDGLSVRGVITNSREAGGAWPCLHAQGRQP